MAPHLETWVVTSLGNSRFVSPADAAAFITAWREAEVLSFEVTSPGSIVQRFDLGAIFSSPVVESLDQCLARPAPNWTLPVTGVPATPQGNLVYTADATLGSTWANTVVQLQASADPAAAGGVATSSRLLISCGIDGIGVQILDIGSADGFFTSGDSLRVTWTVDNGPPQTSVWDAWQAVNHTYSISPQDDASFYSAIEGSDSLSINVDSDLGVTRMFDFAGNGFWSTPVQPNLDACGGS